MRARFLKKCKCKDTGYVKLQQTKTQEKVKYLELEVNCRQCGRPWKLISPKGPFDGHVIFTNAKPEKKKTPKSKAPPKNANTKTPKEPEKDKMEDPKKKEPSKVSLVAKKIAGVVFDKDRD